VLGGIGTPGAPPFGTGEQRARRGTASACASHGPKQPDVGRRECIRFAQRAHGDVLRRPLADAVECPQLGNDVVQVAADAEQMRIARDRTCERHERRRSSARHRQGPWVDCGEAVGARKHVSQSIEGHTRHAVDREWFSVRNHEPAGQLDGRYDRDLLAEHRANGQLERVPRAGHAKSGTSGHQRREDGILGQLLRDRVRVGGQVELTPHARDDRGQR